VTVSVGGNNGGLMAVDDNASTPVDVAVAIDVLANDVAGNAIIDAGSVAILTMPSSGGVEVNASTGVVTYTPDNGFEGTDTFTYTMKDVDGYTSNEATVTVNVGGNNGGLMAADDSAGTIVDTPVTVDILANDTGGNAPLDPASVAIATMPSDGNVEILVSNGAVTYTPDAGFIGTDTFTYTVNDTDGYTSNVATVTITVDPAPTGPIANDDAVQVNPNSFVSIAILDNDAEGSAPIDPASVSIVTEPAHGDYSVTAEGVVDYIPEAGFVGQDSFEYTVEDIDGRVSNVAVVSIDVTSDSDLAITITVDEVTPSIDSNVEFTITITNDGDQVFSNIVVDESLPSGYEFVGSQSAEGDYNNITAKWTISHIGAQGTAMLKLTAKVVAVAGADYLNVVTIEESSPVDSNLENNTAQVAVEPLLLVVYNEFSPNGDGFNDTFVIDGIQLYPNNVLKVYNRYGSLVFQTSNYNNDWDGVANKSGAIMSKDRLPVGTYFYVLDTGTGIKKSGWLYIAR
ncbi:Ig-like domain-containing protein, partial [Sinomicrobium oceani]|uniref:Ig-like domain-containing protein n=1 Tax=Sinomicrobium oceani TaxID=1150368 RepID=UPI00227AA30E